MNFISIGSEFYQKSGFMMCSLYTEDGKGSDWGKVQLAVKDGHTVTIRPANDKELLAAYRHLEKLNSQ